LQALQTLLKGLRGVQALTFGQRCAACESPCADAVVCIACTECSVSQSPRCPRCATTMGHAHLCGACISRPPSFDAAVCVGSFTEPLSGLIAQYKFASRLVLAPWFAAQIDGALLKNHLNSSQGVGFDLIAAVPLYDTRLAERGFNQAWEIAKHLSISPRAPKRAVLTRLRDTPSQRSVNAAQRFSNVRGAFLADESVRGLRVLLIDDVVTTTATVDAVSQALKTAGALHITVACIARVSDE
jgi:ComF family protein